MKLAIIGSRKFNNKVILNKVLNEYVDKVNLVISGGAFGADFMGEEWAKENKIETSIFKPDWEKFGKSAGFIRNQDIVKNSDEVVAFWDGKSKGTEHSIKLCERLKIPVKIVYF